MTEESKTKELEIQVASQGHGPLWQRDYRAQVKNSAQTPEEIMSLIRAQFPSFAPAELAAFSHDGSTPLEVGDEMKVAIKGYGECAVRVVHMDERSFTLRTVEGHFEAGRITFGAYYENEILVLRVCSRARSAGRLRHVGYLLLGQKLQEQTWVIFLQRVAEKIGGELIGEIEVVTKETKSTLADMGELDTPVFIAKDRP